MPDGHRGWCRRRSGIIRATGIPWTRSHQLGLGMLTRERELAVGWPLSKLPSCQRRSATNSTLGPSTWQSAAYWICPRAHVGVSNTPAMR